MLIKQEELDKYDLVLRNIEKDLVGTRWGITSLSEYLHNKYGINKLTVADESGLVSDYAFIAPINKDWGYVDIYYLSIPYDKADSGDTLYITEVNVEKE